MRHELDRQPKYSRGQPPYALAAIILLVTKLTQSSVGYTYDSEMFRRDSFPYINLATQSSPSAFALPPLVGAWFFSSPPFC